MYHTVLSTRLRLSRNVENYRFPGTMDREEGDELQAGLKTFLLKKDPVSAPFSAYSLAALSLREKLLLRERNILTSRQMENRRGTVVLGKGEELNCLLCVDDHVQIIGLGNGYCLPSLYNEAKALADEADREFPFARDEVHGYLTSRVTEAGTGLRASVIMQLSALSLMEDMDPLFLALMERGLCIRGYMDDQEQSRGGLYQIYCGGNGGYKRTDEILNSFSEAVKILSEREEACRREINRGRYPQLEDRISRSLGVLRYCRMISAGEAYKHLMLLRQGICLGWITEISLEAISALGLFTGQAHVEGLLSEEGTEPTAELVDERRARLIRETLDGNLSFFGE